MQTAAKQKKSFIKEYKQYKYKNKIISIWNIDLLINRHYNIAFHVSNVWMYCRFCGI